MENSKVVTVTDAEFARIRHGDKVTILVPAGIGREGQEWKQATGRAVMRSAHGGWVLNMGGAHGTPGIADLSNTVAVHFGRGPRPRKPVDK
jgi:hypothetical protein